HMAESTAKVLGALTDENLAQPVADGHRTLGQLAWHIVVTVPEMMSRIGLQLSSVDHEAPPPDSAEAIRAAQITVTRELLDALKSGWNDGTLSETDDMYGQLWSRGMTLTAMVNHEAHHRGQMTVLLRQAGAVVPGVFGPAKE
ncbi:MAG: DinB family protein, partial [bacterium]